MILLLMTGRWRWAIGAAFLLFAIASGCESNPSPNPGPYVSQSAPSKAAEASVGTGSGGVQTWRGTMFRLTAEQKTMAMAIGEPALVGVGEPYPTLRIESAVDGSVSVEVKLEDGETTASIGAAPVKAGEEKALSVPGLPTKPGRYEMRVTMEAPGYAAYFDRIDFTVLKQGQTVPDGAVYVDDTGKLQYLPDYKGNTIPDFSNAGYRGGGVALPDAVVQATLEPSNGNDDTARIQAAIETVARLPANEDGYRGAVLLKRGTYRINSTIKLKSSGVVLRGEGTGTDGTVLLATGTDKRPLIEASGSSGAKAVTTKAATITDQYVPVGARSFHVDSAKGLNPGDSVLVRKIGNASFISYLKMDKIKPRPDDPASTKMWTPFNLDFDRVVTAVSGNRVTVDAPLTDAIDSRWGGGQVMAYTDSGRIKDVGIENLRGDTEFNKAVVKTNQGQSYYADEKHADDFIKLDNVKNAWVRDVAATHFSFAAVDIGKGAKAVTVEDAEIQDMVSLLDGSRRYAFNVNGELCLVQRVSARSARHSFVLGSRVEGPNVFLQADSHDTHNTSEPHQRWSVGGLYDNVSGPIAVQDRQYYGSGHGWAGANYVLWNTSGKLVAQKPPTAQTWVIGHVGELAKGAFEPRDKAFVASLGKHVEPVSLYLKQLEDRLGPEAAAKLGAYHFSDASPEDAAGMIEGDD